MGRFSRWSVSNQLISLASRERVEVLKQILELSVSNQLISLASREGRWKNQCLGAIVQSVSNQLISLASREFPCATTIAYETGYGFPIN